MRQCARLPAMAHLLNVESVSVAHAARTVLDRVSLGLDDGARVGVVGRNGGGKSTLLRVLARRQEPDDGRITHTRDIEVALLAQTDDPGTGLRVRDLVLDERADDHTWAGDRLARDVVDGLLADVGLDACADTLSGGQRRRVALAALLARPRDVLLLDEPTNHLDVEGVAWLAAHLRERWPEGRGALVVVTHDRWFLDAVCDRTWEVHDGQVDSYEGGYAAYVLARAERSRTAAVTADRRANLMRKELAWLRRGAPARTSKPRFRLDAAAALIANEPPPRDSMELTRTATARLGKDVLDLEDVSVAFGAGAERRVLLDGVTWRLAPGERVGLVGVNGSGKTTLLRVLLGQVRPDAGRVRRGKTVVPAMLTQDVRELDDLAHLRVGQAVEQVRGTVTVGGRELTAGQLLERLGFARERVWTPVGELSGGERRRLQLLRLLVGEPNVLLLDEPTNDLDTDTLAAIEDTLDGWPGTLVVVSHDRYLLERVTDHQVALLGDGALRDLPGGVQEYLQLRAAARGSGTVASATARSMTPPTPPVQTSADPAAARQARKDMARIERQLQRLSERADRLHAEMVDAAGAADHVRLTDLDARLRELDAERLALEEEWLTAADTAG